MTKICRDCKINKPLEEFYTHLETKDGRLGSCKICCLQKSKLHRQLPQNKERSKDRAAAWRAANPEKVKEARNKAYLKYKDSDKNKERIARRRARTQSQSIVSLKKVLETHGKVCNICTKTIDQDNQLVFDHVIPLARGGSHTEDNIRPAHRSCNAWKGSRLQEEIRGLVPPEPGQDTEWETRKKELAKKARSERAKELWANGTFGSPEWRRKISASREKYKEILAQNMKRRWEKGEFENRPLPSEEVIAARTQRIKEAWENKTAEELKEHAAKISAAKQGSSGNIENLKKGHNPEVRAKAIQISADVRRGKPESEEHRQSISEGLKRAYAEGRRKSGHSEETKRKISETKKTKAALSTLWAQKYDYCIKCQTNNLPHKGRGFCTKCFYLAKKAGNGF